MELCKTRPKKEVLTFFNFYVAGLPRAGANSKPHHCKQKVQKMRDLAKKWV